MVEMVAIRQIYGDGVNAVPSQQFSCREDQAEHYASNGLAEYVRPRPPARPKYAVYETKVVLPDTEGRK